MERDPEALAKRNYFRSISVRKFKPRFFWYRCKCCGQEYRREVMYQCTEPSMRFTWSYHYEGCINCFLDEKHFRQWLTEEGYLLDEEAFDNPDKWRRLFR